MGPIDHSLANFFKPEIKASARSLIAQDKISIQSATDTEIHAFTKTSPSVRVRLWTSDITSSSFTARCSCPIALKNQFCKHVWATLLLVEKKHPDFLNSKVNIEKFGNPLTDSGASSPKVTPKPMSRNSEKIAAFKEAARLRANSYRKEQYQKQKAQAKPKKDSKNTPSKKGGLDYDDEIAALLDYFSKNGFEMPNGPDEATIHEAKRKLSRVFHPDKGGSHDEITELNQNCETLLEY